MKIYDDIYGDFEINEPVLVDLLVSKDLARLKGVSQYGIPDKYYFKIGFDRFEHSVGAMLLLRKLGANIDEQVAGLIHDISQFSFSHISDWVFADGKKGVESYHDTKQEQFVTKKTDVPKILEKYNYSTEYILNEDNFPLLENTLPDICADRIDYSLREIFHNNEHELTKTILQGMVVKDNIISFNIQKTAKQFALAFLDLQINHWASREAVIRYFMFSNAFKKAVGSGIIKHDDFWDKSESELIDILLQSDDSEILSILTKLENDQIESQANEKVFKKFRYVDPFVLTDSGNIRLSKIDLDFNNTIKKAREDNSRGIIA